MKIVIGNTKITFHTDYCCADNQCEVDEIRLKKIASQVQSTLTVRERFSEKVC